MLILCVCVLFTLGKTWYILFFWQAVRVEHCERVHVIVAAKRICIANCRECVFFLGVNQQPLILGDNHKLQVSFISLHDLWSWYFALPGWLLHENVTMKFWNHAKASWNASTEDSKRLICNISYTIGHFSRHLFMDRDFKDTNIMENIQFFYTFRKVSSNIKV